MPSIASMHPGAPSNHYPSTTNSSNNSSKESRVNKWVPPVSQEILGSILQKSRENSGKQFSDLTADQIRVGGVVYDIIGYFALLV